MLEVKTEADRDRLYADCQARWKSEDEVTSREMRKMLRRKMTRLSLGHLNQVTVRSIERRRGRLVSFFYFCGRTMSGFRGGVGAGGEGGLILLMIRRKTLSEASEAFLQKFVLSENDDQKPF